MILLRKAEISKDRKTHKVKNSLGRKMGVGGLSLALRLMWSTRTHFRPYFLI